MPPQNQHTNKQSILDIDTLIVGQGLAGSILAWQLMRQGQKVVIVCDEHASSASRVAAGIFNPVSGQRFVLQAQTEHIIASARQCYAQLETKFGQKFFHAKAMLRVFKHGKERQHFDKRCHDTHYTPYLGQYVDSIAGVDAPHGLGQQHQTGYLDFNALLDCLRQDFIAQDSYLAEHFAYSDLKHTVSGIIWKHIHAKRIIFCQGFIDQDNPYFKQLPFQPTKGEILTLVADAALPDQMINAGKWLLPLSNGYYKIGATYDHDLSDSEPTEQAKSELLSGFQELLSAPINVDVIDQQAGIRPNTLDKQPFIGFHSEQQYIGIFNGFGSKGAMLIPHYVQAFAQHISTGSPIPSEADIARINAKKKKQPRLSLTKRVHQSLITHIESKRSESKRSESNQSESNQSESNQTEPNHIVIDATAGNGHDTLFLASHINGKGQVFAFDIQRQAINNTHKKLKQAGLNDRVTLFCCGHESMLEHIPDELIGKINLIMFNLGYLPQADKTIITQMATTLTALDAAIQLIAPYGRISILAYPGHTGGDKETDAVKTWAANLPRQRYTIIMHESLHSNSTSPVWIEVIRKDQASC